MFAASPASAHSVLVTSSYKQQQQQPNPKMANWLLPISSSSSSPLSSSSSFTSLTRATSTNGNLSNSISQQQQQQQQRSRIDKTSFSSSVVVAAAKTAAASKDAAASVDGIELCIDQLVNDLDGLIQIGCSVKRQLIRQWAQQQQHWLREGTADNSISSQSITSPVSNDDMIKIDSNPIKIDDVIGHITQMDRFDDCTRILSLSLIFVTLERSLTLSAHWRVNMLVLSQFAAIYSTNYYCWCC